MTVSIAPYTMQSMSDYDEFTRAMQEVDVIYVGHMLGNHKDSESIFISPDGEGRIFFESIEQAREDFGNLRVHHLHGFEVTDW